MSVTNTISVVLCTYNGERYLSQQLESILEQSRAPDEIVVCDDGSRDGTLGLVRDFARRACCEVRIFENRENLGSTRNFEQAIALSHGEFVALCDQDDRWYPQKLERLEAELLRQPGVSAVFSDADLIDAEGSRIGKTLWLSMGFERKQQQRFLAAGPLAFLLRGSVVTGATLMFRSALVAQALPISPLWVHDAWLAFIAAIGQRLAFVNERLMGYRLHASQQLGVDSSKAKLVNDPEKRLREAAEMEAMREFLRASASVPYPEDLLLSLHAKALHLEKRARMPRGWLSRVAAVLGEAEGYKRYSNGLTSMVKDAVWYQGM